MKVPTFSAEQGIGPSQGSYAGLSTINGSNARIRMMDDFTDCISRVLPNLTAQQLSDIYNQCGIGCACWANEYIQRYQGNFYTVKASIQECCDAEEAARALAQMKNAAPQQNMNQQPIQSNA
jgi:hypothetical protein